MTEQKEEGKSIFADWAILELRGHRRLAGFVMDVEMFGARMCRIDIPCEVPVTQFYGAAALYCLTPTTEEIARALAVGMNTAPVSRYELPPAPSAWTGRCCASCGDAFTAADVVVLLPTGVGMHAHCYADQDDDPSDEDQEERVTGDPEEVF